MANHNSSASINPVIYGNFRVASVRPPISPRAVASVEVLGVFKPQLLQHDHRLPTTEAASTIHEHGLLAVQFGHLFAEGGIAEGDLLRARDGSTG